MRLTVVSCPATSNRMHVESSSVSLSMVPPSSTWTNALSRSSPGCSRRSASSSKKYWANWATAWLRASMISGVSRKSGSRPRAKAWDHPLNRSWSASWHPEQIADDPDGQRVGERLEEVDPAGLQCASSSSSTDLLGPLAQRLDHLRGEGLGHQSPQPGVVRGVPEQERAHLHHGCGHRDRPRGSACGSRPASGRCRCSGCPSWPGGPAGRPGSPHGGRPPRSRGRSGGWGPAPGGRRRAGRDRWPRWDRTGRRPGAGRDPAGGVPLPTDRTDSTAAQVPGPVTSTTAGQPRRRGGRYLSSWSARCPRPEGRARPRRGSSSSWDHPWPRWPAAGRCSDSPRDGRR